MSQIAPPSPAPPPITPYLPPQAAAPGQTRALALDALRGFAILTMCLSGVLPRDLPLWMYHAQVPNYSGYNPAIPGITWVDLVFPMFLFSMGAAFPFALSRRLEQGVAAWRLVGGILFRGLSLVFFAVYIQNANPYAWTSPSGAGKWWLALAAFGVLFLIYMRYPKSWRREWQWGLRAAGIVLAFVVMSVATYPEGAAGTGWSVRRNDIIIMVLANMAVSGSVIWLLTRRSLMMRLFVLLGAWAALESYKSAGASWVYHLLKPPSLTIGEAKYGIDWMYNFSWQKYLFIVVPGTMVGDLLLGWMKNRDGDGAAGWTRGRLLAISLVMTALTIGLLCGLFGGGIEMQPGQYADIRLPRVAWTVGLAIAAGAACWFALMRRPATGTDRYLRTLFGWGLAWLVLGLLMDPVENGIHKDPANMSYYFTTTGISIFILVALTVWIDLFGMRRSFGLLIASGQNPMIAYAAIRQVMPPIVFLIPLQEWADKLLPTPWWKFTFSLVKTAIVGVTAAVFTRLRIFWRT